MSRFFPCKTRHSLLHHIHLFWHSPQGQLTSTGEDTDSESASRERSVCLIKCIKIELVNIFCNQAWPVNRAFCAIRSPPLVCRSPLPLQALNQTVKQRYRVPASTLATELANTNLSTLCWISDPVILQVTCENCRGCDESGRNSSLMYLISNFNNIFVYLYKILCLSEGSQSCSERKYFKFSFKCS